MEKHLTWNIRYVDADNSISRSRHVLLNKLDWKKFIWWKPKSGGNRELLPEVLTLKNKCSTEIIYPIKNTRAAHRYSTSILCNFRVAAFADEIA